MTKHELIKAIRRALCGKHCTHDPRVLAGLARECILIGYEPALPIAERLLSYAEEVYLFRRDTSRISRVKCAADELYSMLFDWSTD